MFDRSQHTNWDEICAFIFGTSESEENQHIVDAHREVFEAFCRVINKYKDNHDEKIIKYVKKNTLN